MCSPDIFCKRLEDDFSSVFTEQMFPSLSPPLPCNGRKLSLPQRTHGVAAVRLIRRARAGTRESHADDCLAGELLGVCVPPPFLPISVVSRCSQLAEWPCFVWSLTPMLHPIPLLQANHNLPKTLASFFAWLHSSPLLHPELCSLSLIEK